MSLEWLFTAYGGEDPSYRTTLSLLISRLVGADTHKRESVAAIQKGLSMFFS